MRTAVSFLFFAIASSSSAQAQIRTTEEVFRQEARGAFNVERVSQRAQEEFVVAVKQAEHRYAADIRASARQYSRDRQAAFREMVRVNNSARENIELIAAARKKYQKDIAVAERLHEERNIDARKRRDRATDEAAGRMVKRVADEERRTREARS